MDLSSIQSLTFYLSFYAPYFILVIGNIGCLCNFLTFTTKSLRQNSCGWYFLLSAIFDFAYINFGLITKLASEQYGSTLQNTNLGWCRIRVFLTWVLPCFATSYLLLASLDRCLSTSRSVRLRSFSQIRIAHRISFVPIIIYSLSTSHQFFYYHLRSGCAPLSGTYAYFLSMYSIVWTSLIPQLTMLICGFLTYWNIRKIHQRITPRAHNRTDANLIQMTLFQVLSSSILLNFRAGYYAYSVFSSDFNKDDYRRAIENLFLLITSLAFYLNFTKSFFVNTLTSKLFRKRFYKRLRSIYRRMKFHYPRVHPNADHIT